ncbi:MAG: metallophosphoesterase [Promethearchaeota archaeon]
MNFDFQQLDEAMEILEKEPMLFKLKDISNSIIIGDTHGDFASTKYLINKYLDAETISYLIFLGDYVDRGPQQIENINFLIENKLAFPKKLILLRGNHEWIEMNQNYGFYQEVLTQFGKPLYERYLELFSKLSIAFHSLRPIKAIGVHGGIPVDPSRSRTYELSDINKIHKNQKIYDEDNLITQIVWNDPKEGLDYISPSFRGAGYFYGIKAFKEFMEHNDLQYCFRSHEAFSEVRKFFNGFLYSIFTCRYYGIVPNFLKIKSNGEIEIKTIV